MPPDTRRRAALIAAMKTSVQSGSNRTPRLRWTVNPREAEGTHIAMKGQHGRNVVAKHGRFDHQDETPRHSTLLGRHGLGLADEVPLRTERCTPAQSWAYPSVGCLHSNSLCLCRWLFTASRFCPVRRITFLANFFKKSVKARPSDPAPTGHPPSSVD